MAKYTRILSLDGGGIRGIIPGQILVALEKKLQDKKDDTNVRLADYFDLMAGTSTGGILTCIYLCPDEDNPGRPRFSAQEAADLYLEKGDEIFKIPWRHKIRTAGGLRDEKYPSDGLEEALDDYFKEIKLSNLLGPCLVTAYDIKRRKGHFFRQHVADNNDAYNFHIKDVARATSAAPTYFECARVKSFTNINYPLVDGGVFVNNPTLCAYAEARKLFTKNDEPEKHVTAKDMVILSLGTGHAKKSYSYDEAKDWGMIEWVTPVIDIMMSGVAETVDYQLDQIYNAVEAEEQYLRINPRLPHDVNPDMDDATQENVDALRQLGTETAEDHDDELNELVKLLLMED